MDEKPMKVSVYLPKELHTETKVIAARKGLTLSAVFEEALKRYVEEETRVTK